MVGGAKSFYHFFSGSPDVEKNHLTGPASAGERLQSV